MKEDEAMITQVKTTQFAVAEEVKPFRVRKFLRRMIFRPAVSMMIAATGIFGGISALFVGLVCICIHSFTIGDRAFDRVGTVLLIVAIPMILLGSIFVDEIGSSK